MYVQVHTIKDNYITICLSQNETIKNYKTVKLLFFYITGHMRSVVVKYVCGRVGGGKPVSINDTPWPPNETQHSLLKHGKIL